MKQPIPIIIASILFFLFCVWVYSATGRVKVKHLSMNEKIEECEVIALNLLIGSIENSRWLQRRFYEVHVKSKHCNVVINYYPQENILSIATDPCSGFWGHFLLSIPELSTLKNRKSTFDDLVKNLKRPPENADFDIPNSLCDLFIIF